ncbi:MmpS family protein [Mycolicibacterium sphagni]|nr:MmpS family protein [Mycolicibacterium sphagni]MCV7175063.1 hypothetical protein [Mycolicibacterium sphagni]
MSGPNPPDEESGGQHSDQSSEEHRSETPTGTGFEAYSAPEAEQYTAGPFVAPDPGLYDYDSYEAGTEYIEEPRPPKWPWVVGVTAIIAAIALVVSVSLLVTSTDTNNLATPATTTVKPPPVQDQIITTTQPPAPPPPPPPTTTEEPPPPPPPTQTVTVTTEPPPPPPPPPPATTEAPPPVTTTTAPPAPATTPTTPTTTTTPSGPRQVTYSITGTKAPGDIISVTYVDASGRQRTQRNVYIPWSLTVTPISQSDVGSVQASSLFLVSRLNCSITTSDGVVLSSNQNNAAQTSC